MLLFQKHLLSTLLLLSPGSALPALGERSRSSSIAANVLHLAPSTSTCASSSGGAECCTAAEAAPFLLRSFQDYDIKSSNTRAALVAHIMFETGDLTYSRNHFPGVPGQGTRNMQSPAFNTLYAQWVAEHWPNKYGFDASNVAAAESGGPDAVLALVNGNVLGFGSAAWFLQTQCPVSVAKGLASGNEESWREFLTGCVGTTVTEERTALWREAVELGW